MKLLALESSAKAASCAVFAGGELLASAWQAAGLTHSRTLLPMVEDMLRNCGLAAADMDAFAVAAGPGSFTGLRIGVSAVKGLAWGLEKPCIPVSTLEAMAWPLAHLEGNIVCAMDARRQQIYNAVFLAEGGELKRLREDRAISLEDLGAELKNDQNPKIVVGDGAVLCYNSLSEQGIAARLAPVPLRMQSAWGVAQAAVECSRRGERVEAGALALSYCRLSQAERERLNKEKGNCHV